MALPLPQGHPQEAMTTWVVTGSFLQQSGTSSLRWAWACSCAFLEQQQLCDALLSAEQPQMSQSPEHSPVRAWSTAFDCSAGDSRGLNEMNRYSTIIAAATMVRRGRENFWTDDDIAVVPDNNFCLTWIFGKSESGKALPRLLTAGAGYGDWIYLNRFYQSFFDCTVLYVTLCDSLCPY